MHSKNKTAGEAMTVPQPLQLLAPLSGVLVPLDHVPDPVFANRVIGDGPVSYTHLTLPTKA